jgi:nicotinamidase-related amidase
MTGRTLQLRTRSVAAAGEDNVRAVLRNWDPAATAVVVCDMWDAHHCLSAARRVEELAPRVNDVLGALREGGALIIHAPADCMEFYRDVPARHRAATALPVPASAAFGWNDWEPEEVRTLPESLTAPGPCSCESDAPCNSGSPPYPWTRQTPLIEVGAEDAITDDGQEMFNLLEERGLTDVIVMGVHTNICVLSRSYGIRQLVFLGKRPMLCRDLTDAFHRDPRGQAWGTEQIIAHIERMWCPTVTSDQLMGGMPFAFA